MPLIRKMRRHLIGAQSDEGIDTYQFHCDSLLNALETVKPQMHPYALSSPLIRVIRESFNYS